jgi:BlaI family penicillinase repressor
MPRIPHGRLTEHEWRIMQIIWRLRKCAARDVYEAAGRDFGWAPTTVKTYLALLVEKGQLKTTRVGNSFLYEPRVTWLQSLRRAADSLLEKTLGGGDGPLLAYLIRKSQLTGAEIMELRSILDGTKARGEGKKTAKEKSK